jgi:hypothetical protein
MKKKKKKKKGAIFEWLFGKTNGLAIYNKIVIILKS